MKLLLALSFCAIAQSGFAQYRFDNVAFQTVYWTELCKTLQQNPGHLLLDVRSRGEHADTSASKTLNIGHLKGAINIDIREIGTRLNEIATYKNKPVFVYCSHSQRSRRVSKMLADSGFVNVYNINGGVSNLHQFGLKEECELLTSKLPYRIISPLSLAKNGDHFLLDVRPDSSFKSIATQERKNAFGRFKNAVNIPSALLEQKLASLPKNRKILIVDETGNESVAAAELLNQHGYKEVAILFNGLDAYLAEVQEADRKGWVNPVGYHMINVMEFDEQMKKTKGVVVDIRPAEEFSNN